MPDEAQKTTGSGSLFDDDGDDDEEGLEARRCETISLQAALAWLLTGDRGLTERLRLGRVHMPFKKVVELYQAETGYKIETRLNLQVAWEQIAARLVASGARITGTPFRLTANPSDDSHFDEAAPEAISADVVQTLEIVDHNHEGMLLRPRRETFDDPKPWWSSVQIPVIALTNEVHRDSPHESAARSSARQRRPHTKIARIKAFLVEKYGPQGPGDDVSPTTIQQDVAAYFKSREWKNADNQTVLRARKELRALK